MLDTATTAAAELLFLGARARILVSGAETGGTLSLIEMRDVPAGDRSPLHVHHVDDEGFYVLDGEVTLFLPGREVTLREGQFFLAPKGIPHAYCAGPDGASWLVTSTPAGFEGFVVEVSGLERVDPETLGAVAARHEIEILGPPGMVP